MSCAVVLGVNVDWYPKINYAFAEVVQLLFCGPAVHGLVAVLACVCSTAAAWGLSTTQETQDASCPVSLVTSYNYISVKVY